MSEPDESMQRHSELRDQRERDAAVHDDDALVSYERKWQRKLAKLQRAHPERWRVPGLSEDEVRDTLTLRLIEVVRGDPAEFARYERAGKEWGLVFFSRQLLALRRRFRLDATPTDLRHAPLLQQAASVEEHFIDREAAAVQTLATQRAEHGLSRPQRRWLSAMKLSANAGAFFDSSDQPNLSAASRVLGKHRSSAARAYRELQEHFAKELERLL